MYFFSPKKKHFDTGPPEYGSKHLFLSFSQNVAEIHSHSESDAETVLIIPMASDTKLKWFTL